MQLAQTYKVPSGIIHYSEHFGHALNHSSGRISSNYDLGIDFQGISSIQTLITCFYFLGICRRRNMLAQHHHHHRKVTMAAYRRALNTSTCHTFCKVKSQDSIINFVLPSIRRFKSVQKHWNWFAIWMIRIWHVFRRFSSKFQTIIHYRRHPVYYSSMKWMQRNFWNQFSRYLLFECWKCHRCTQCHTFWTHGKCPFVKHAHQTSAHRKYQQQRLHLEFENQMNEKCGWQNDYIEIFNHRFMYILFG